MTVRVPVDEMCTPASEVGKDFPSNPSTEVAAHSTPVTPALPSSPGTHFLSQPIEVQGHTHGNWTHGQHAFLDPEVILGACHSPGMCNLHLSHSVYN